MGGPQPGGGIGKGAAAIAEAPLSNGVRGGLVNTVLYYFSGTGNSFAIARDISQKMNARLISIPSVMHMDAIHIDADRVGIVFPSYIAPIAGFPLIIERFVNKISNMKSLSVFAVCTCGGYECVNALPSLRRLQNIIKERGGKLSGKYSVRLPMNNLDYDHIPIPIITDHNEIIRRSNRKVNAISARIAKGKGTTYRFAKTLFLYLMAPLYSWMRPSIMRDLKRKAKESDDSALTYRALMPLTDKSIVVEGHCTGCGICAKVCPVGNIEMVSQRPEFRHRCEICFACDEWCPQNAIQHWSRGKGIKYHHPSVKTPAY